MTLIRTFREADYPAVVALRNAMQPEPIDEATLREQDEQHTDDPSTIRIRLVAEDEAGRLVGYANAGHWNWLPPQRFSIHVGVAAAQRGRGIGEQLLRAAEEWALAHGAEGELTGWARGDDEPSFAWLQRRGWRLDLQRTESVLDLKGWDESRFAGHLDRVRSSGIALLALSEPSDEIWRGIYEVERLTASDVPDYEGHMPTYEEWLRDFVAIKAPKVIAVALDGERVVGVSSLLLPRVDGAGGDTFYTGVLREYRGRGIALALKLLTIEGAVASGVPHMRTNNDVENPAMLAVNDRLGYQMVPGPRRMKKAI